MKRLFVGLVLGLVLVGVFVSGGYFPDENRPEVFAIDINKGWNLIYGFNDPGQIVDGDYFESSNIEAIYAFIPTTQEYLRALPNPDGKAWENLDNVFDDHELLQTAFWVYSNKEGIMNYNLIDDFDSVNGKKLYEGWNLFAVSPDLIYANVSSGRMYDIGEVPTLNSVKGDCDIQKAYVWDDKWVAFGMADDFLEDVDILLGRGIVIKVSSDCVLGKGTSPPGLPGGGSGIAWR